MEFIGCSFLVSGSICFLSIPDNLTFAMHVGAEGINCLVVDKTRNMEHSGIFRNIPEHPRTSNNYDNNDKNM